MQKEIKRICQSCRQLKDRNFLLRITKLKDNTLIINPKSNEIGRSAYICNNKNCIENFIKKKKYKTSLKNPPQEEVLRLIEVLKSLF